MIIINSLCSVSSGYFEKQKKLKPFSAMIWLRYILKFFFGSLRFHLFWFEAHKVDKGFDESEMRLFFQAYNIHTRKQEHNKTWRF